jgi:glycosyltransferase involved in cell wall biosynthesis
MHGQLINDGIKAEKVALLVYYVEPVGGHLGMHYYDFSICRELTENNIKVVLQTCDETEPFSNNLNFPVRFPFKKIYGGGKKILRGWRYLKGQLKILLSARKEKACILHFHYFHFLPVDWTLIKLSKKMGFRIVITVHDVVPFDAGQKEIPWLRRLYHAGDAVIVHTQDSYNEIKEKFGLDEKKVTIIPQGPYFHFSEKNQISRESARNKLGITQMTKMILFFGQIKKVKGIDHLIAAFPKVLEAFPESRLVIAGPEWRHSFANYTDTIRDLGIEDKVLLRIEHIPEEDVAFYFTAADVVVLPYTKVYQSAVLFMAHSFAKPIVASAIGGLAEVIKHRETGILVPPGDESALADALIEVLKDEQKAAEMGFKGKTEAAEIYGWSSIARKTADLYTLFCTEPKR